MSARPDLVVLVGSAAPVRLVCSALALLGPELDRQGVRVGDPDAVPGVGGAPALVLASSAAPPPFDPSDAWAFLTPALDDVRAVLDTSGARRARIVLCPERQDRLVERAYRTAVGDGFSGTLPDRFPRQFEPLLDFGTVVGQLRSAPGVSDVRVVPLELVAAGPAAFVGEVLDALEAARPVELDALRDWQVPREPGPRGVQIAAALNAHLDTDEERDRVRDYVLTNFSVPVGASPAVLDKESRAQILAAYRGMNEDFFARFASEYPTSAYSGRAGLDSLAAVLAPVRLPGERVSSGSRVLRGVRRRLTHRSGRRGQESSGQGGS